MASKFVLNSLSDSSLYSSAISLITPCLLFDRLVYSRLVDALGAVTLPFADFVLSPFYFLDPLDSFLPDALSVFYGKFWLL